MLLKTYLFNTYILILRHVIKNMASYCVIFKKIKIS